MNTRTLKALWLSPIPTATAFVGLLATLGSAASLHQVTAGMFVSDCSAPADKAITAWIATIPDNSVVKFAAGACYGIDDSISVPSRNHLTFEGNGATFKAITLNCQTRANWNVTGGADIVFRQMTIIGFNPKPGPNGGGTGVPAGACPAQCPCPQPNQHSNDYEWQHGINFAGVANALVDQVNISSVYGDFIDAQFNGTPKPDGKGGLTGMTPTRNLIVQGSHFDGSGRQGFGLLDVDGFTLKNSYVGNVAQAGIDLELYSYGSVGRNILIDGNTFGPVWFSVFSNRGAGYPGDVGNITISHNVQVAPLKVGEESCQPPVYVLSPPGVYRSGYVITENKFRVMGGVVVLTRAKNVKIAGNTLLEYGNACSGSGDTAVNLTDSHVVSVTNNNFAGEPRLITKDSLTTGLTSQNNKP